MNEEDKVRSFLGLLWRGIEVSPLLISMESVITWIYEKQLFKGMARGVS